MSASTPDLPDALGTLAPPSRFEDARLATYQAETPGQERALKEAHAFVERVQTAPSLARRLRTWARRLLPVGSAAPPRGLYLVGPAGTGKTHLMAALYHRLAPEVSCAFVHSSALFRAARHPEQLAHTLARDKNCRVLMLDEVELDDAANEARLAHFLRVLSEEGVTLLATSNARPDEFMSRHVSGGGRHRRFLTDALAGRCEVVFVEGADRRLAENKGRGRIFVGPPEAAQAVLRRTYEADDHRTRWLSFDELRKASTETAHERLMTRLLAPEGLYVAGVALQGTDDALRLLRIIDDLYVTPKAPALFFSSAAAPEDWFTADTPQGLAHSVADKFTRTASRLHELCEVHRVDEAPVAVDER